PAEPTPGAPRHATQEGDGTRSRRRILSRRWQRGARPPRWASTEKTLRRPRPSSMPRRTQEPLPRFTPLSSTRTGKSVTIPRTISAVRSREPSTTTRTSPFHRCSPRKATTRSRRRPIRRSSLHAGMTTLRSPLPWPTAFAASPRTHVMPSARDGDGIRADAVAMPSPDVQSPTVAWFAGARFGLFIHWGHGSQRGWELSWPLVGGVRNLRHCQDVPAETYHANARTFAPRPGAAREWLAAAPRCGVRYAVVTAKHHGGFALFRSRVSDFSIAATPYPGDLVREYVDATRAAGLRIGLYFSLCDWHHPDYPPFTDADRPYRFGLAPRPTDAQWARYSEFLFAQLRELLTDYGHIDLLWFDGGWERSAEAWRARELEAMIRALQPGIAINDRLPGAGDYNTPEQFIPPDPPGRAWETCLTMNESWAWNPADRDYKSARALVHALCEIAGRGGNLLLDVSPMGDGALPPEQVE